MNLRILISSLCVLAGLAISAQDTINYTPLADRLADYGQLTVAWDIDGLLDFTAPGLLEIVPRAALREQMTGLQSDDDMTVTFHDFFVDRIGEAVTLRGESFAPVTCHHGITFELKSDAYRAPVFAARMVRMLEKSYGDVRYDAATHRIDVRVEKTMYAIRRTPSAEWFFVEYRPENAGLMDLLIPPAVREQLNN